MAFDPTSGFEDFGFLPSNFTGDVQTFFTGNNAQGSQKWLKPRGVTMCYMVCIGSGGGGGGGFTGASTTARGGGAGGGSSSIAKMLIPALFLPDVLLVQVGSGGKGGAANANGGTGVNSIISYGVGLTAIGTSPNIILQSNNAAPGGGGAGTGAAGGTGGTVPTISTQAISGAAASWGVQSFIVGLAGGGGGAQTGAAGTAVNNAWNLICCGSGAGGGGVNSVNSGFAGGNIGFVGSLDFADGAIVTGSLVGGTAGSSTAAGNGNSGIQLWKPFYMTGGSGGGSSDGSTGGNGGNGGIGCGGGGGGGGTTGGTGGNGGDGFVCIISW